MIYEEDLKNIDKFIGKRICLSRIAKNMSGKELAQLMEITEDQLLKYELGLSRISIIKLIHTAKLLKEDINFFFPDEII